VRPSGTYYDNGASSQPGGRDISLHTFHNQNATSQAPANGNSSTIYAGRQTKSPFSGDLDDNRVMMTTDVIVVTEELKQDETEVHRASSVDLTSGGGRSTIAGGRAGQQKGAYSANSSEIEFAGAGY